MGNHFSIPIAAIASLIHPDISAFPERVVGSACTSSFSRLARHSLALRPAHSRCHQCVTRYTEGFSHFVTSMTAPVASGWSDRRLGLAPTGKAPPYHGAHPMRALATFRPDCERPEMREPKRRGLPKWSVPTHHRSDDSIFDLEARLAK